MLAPRGQRRTWVDANLRGDAPSGRVVAGATAATGAIGVTGEEEAEGELDVKEDGELLWLMVRQYYDESKRLFRFIER